jgi:hypothetical protein
MEQTDPLTGQIDLDLINTGAGSATRRLRGDLKREVRRGSPPHSFSYHQLRFRIRGHTLINRSCN